MSNPFTVPTLSLSNSRAKKHNITTVPTRDYSQITPSFSHLPSNESYIDNKYPLRTPYITQQLSQKPRRPPIFPPKPSPPLSDLAPKDINKNVYLQSNEQYPSPPPPSVHFTHPLQPEHPQLLPSNSRRALLTNPGSSRLIQEQQQERQATRRMDVSKVLFDRKLSKLLQEANFYEEQLQSACQDQLGPKLQELMDLKEESINSHKELILGLTALIQ